MQLTRTTSKLGGQENVNCRRLRLACLVELLQQAFQVSQPVAAGGMLERLVLGENVDESLAHLVTVLPQRLPARLTQRFDDIADPAFGAEAFRHSVAALAVRPS